MWKVMNGLAKCLELTLITLLLITKEMLSKIVSIKNASHKPPWDTIHSIVKTNEWVAIFDFFLCTSHKQDI